MSALTDAVQAFVNVVKGHLLNIPANGNLISNGTPGVPFDFTEGYSFVEFPIASTPAEITQLQALQIQYLDITVTPIRLYTFSGSYSSVVYTGDQALLRKQSFCRSVQTGKIFYFDENLLATEWDYTFSLPGDPESPVNILGDYWTTITTTSAYDLVGVVGEGSGLVVAIGRNTNGGYQASYSTNNGNSWSSANQLASTAIWTSVCYGNGTYVAVGMTGSYRAMSGAYNSWTLRTAAAMNTWRSVCYGNGLFVAVSSDGAGSQVMTSPDGITWTLRTTPSNKPWLHVTYGNGLFVAVSAGSGGTISYHQVMTSPDGITWTLRSTPTQIVEWSGIAYGNGRFIVTGSSTQGMTSTDGINWFTFTDVPIGVITFGGGYFYSIFGTSNSTVYRSPDGVNWTGIVGMSSNPSGWSAITYNNGRLIAVGNAHIIATT